MLTLYVKTGCPFCAKVLAKLEELQIPFEQRNIKDPEVARELIEEGGKRQVPFLEDDNKTPYLVDDDVEMYESDDIVAYLEEKFGGGKTTDQTKKAENVNLHRDDGADVCESCQ